MHIIVYIYIQNGNMYEILNISAKHIGEKQKTMIIYFLYQLSKLWDLWGATL